jgi:hypothetical protein
MNLLIAYIICVAVGQVLAVGVGLLVERIHSPSAGLMLFIPLYFAMFVIAWKVAVRLTEPKGQSQDAATT